MDLGLDGKVALVAGGSSGLGLAIAMELASEGAQVAIGARGGDQLAAAAKLIASRTRRGLPALAPHATSVDITNAAAARAWVDKVAAELGALHIVVVSGGNPPPGPATRFDVDDYSCAVDQVLMPPVSLTLAALPHLRAAGWGRVLFVASETAAVPLSTLALSGVTRAAITRFAQGVAADVAADNITVNVLAPGATRTAMVERAAARLAAEGDGDVEAQLAAIGARSAIGRLARPEEFAAPAVFLASERASFITGAVHLIDGGGSVVGGEMSHFSAAERDTYT